jgi:hypothetical protein
MRWPVLHASWITSWVDRSPTASDVFDACRRETERYATGPRREPPFGPILLWSLEHKRPLWAGRDPLPGYCRLRPRAPEGIYGREAFIEFVAALGRELPELRFAEGEMVAEGNRVASVFTMASMHGSEEGGRQSDRHGGYGSISYCGWENPADQCLPRKAELVGADGSNLATGSDMTLGFTHFRPHPHSGDTTPTGELLRKHTSTHSGE